LILAEGRASGKMTVNNVNHDRVRRAGYLSQFSKKLTAAAPFILLIAAFAMTAFLGGLWAGIYSQSAADMVHAAGNAYHTLADKFADRSIFARQASDISPSQLAQYRVIVKVPVDDKSDFLLGGGPGQYLDYCPGTGCAAVILRRDGSLAHAYPFRPDEFAKKRTLELPYQEFMYDDAKDTGIIGLKALPNGDLIAVLDLQGTSPYGGGVARLDKDGHVLWYRRDYSDHWPSLTDRNEILSISHKLENPPTDEHFPDGTSMRLACPADKFADLIRVLGLDGSVKEEIPLLDAVRSSPYVSHLAQTFDIIGQSQSGCDLLHTNSVNLVGMEMAAKLKDVQPEDLLVSFRNISALAIVGRADHKLKHFFRGTFLYQHSAEVAPGGDIILFDNVGGGGRSSRVLLYDPATGAERQIFPGPMTPKELGIYNRNGGKIDISADGMRALVAFYNYGKAYEMSLTDGTVLTEFDNVHDVHTMPQFTKDPKKVRYFVQGGVYYVPPNLVH